MNITLTTNTGTYWVLFRTNDGCEAVYNLGAPGGIRGAVLSECAGEIANYGKTDIERCVNKIRYLLPVNNVTVSVVCSEGVLCYAATWRWPIGTTARVSAGSLEWLVLAVRECVQEYMNDQETKLKIDAEVREERTRELVRKAQLEIDEERNQKGEGRL